MMKIIKAAGIVSLLIISFSGAAQNTEGHRRLGREVAREELQTALKELSRHTEAADAQLLLPDSLLAVQVAEPILYRTYGEKNIQRQRPYEVYLIDHYWVLQGTLPMHSEGGTFLIILDARDSRVIELTHSK